MSNVINILPDINSLPQQLKISQKQRLEAETYLKKENKIILSNVGKVLEFSENQIWTEIGHGLFCFIQNKENGLYFLILFFDLSNLIGLTTKQWKFQIESSHISCLADNEKMIYITKENQTILGLYFNSIAEKEEWKEKFDERNTKTRPLLKLNFNKPLKTKESQPAIPKLSRSETLVRKVPPSTDKGRKIRRNKTVDTFAVPHFNKNCSNVKETNSKKNFELTHLSEVGSITTLPLSSNTISQSPASSSNIHNNLNVNKNEILTNDVTLPLSDATSTTSESTHSSPLPSPPVFMPYTKVQPIQFFTSSTPKIIHEIDHVDPISSDIIRNVIPKSLITSPMPPLIFNDLVSNEIKDEMNLEKKHDIQIEQETDDFPFPPNIAISTVITCNDIPSPLPLPPTFNQNQTFKFANSINSTSIIQPSVKHDILLENENIKEMQQTSLQITQVELLPDTKLSTLPESTTPSTQSSISSSELSDFPVASFSLQNPPTMEINSPITKPKIPPKPKLIQSNISKKSEHESDGINNVNVKSHEGIQFTTTVNVTAAQSTSSSKSFPQCNKSKEINSSAPRNIAEVLKNHLDQRRSRIDDDEDKEKESGSSFDEAN